MPPQKAQKYYQKQLVSFVNFSQQPPIIASARLEISSLQNLRVKVNVALNSRIQARGKI